MCSVSRTEIETKVILTQLKWFVAFEEFIPCTKKKNGKR